MLNATNLDMMLVQNQRKLIGETEQKLSAQRITLEIAELVKNLKALHDDKDLVRGNDNDMPASTIYPSLDPVTQHLDLAKVRLQMLMTDRVFNKRLDKEGLALYKPCDDEVKDAINTQVNYMLQAVTNGIKAQQDKKNKEHSLGNMLGVTLALITIALTVLSPVLSQAANTPAKFGVMSGAIAICGLVTLALVQDDKNVPCIVTNANTIAERFFEQMDKKVINETSRGTLVLRDQTFAQKLESFFGQLNPGELALVR